MPDPQHALYKRLAPVCGRMKLQAALNLAVRGLAWGAAAAFVLGLCRVAVRGDWPTIAALVALALGPLTGIVLGMLPRSDWRAAARAVDDRYRLDDRTTTAIAVLAQHASRPMAQLLLRDALDRLQQLAPNEVVPLRIPRGVTGAIGLATVAALVALVPLDAADYLSIRRSDAPSASAGNRPQAEDFRPAGVPPAALQNARATVTVEHPQAPIDDDRSTLLELYDRQTVESYFRTLSP